jgi:hypothetical protein
MIDSFPHLTLSLSMLKGCRPIPLPVCLGNRRPVYLIRELELWLQADAPHRKSGRPSVTRHCAGRVARQARL